MASMLPLSPPPIAAQAAPRVLPSGLQLRDLVEGTGPAATKGRRCSVHYTAWIWWGNRKGPRVDRSQDGAPIQFRLGRGEVIRGWDEGLEGMRTGGRRVLLVPPELAYGHAGAGGGTIPPDSTLCFELELLRVE